MQRRRAITYITGMSLAAASCGLAYAQRPPARIVMASFGQEDSFASRWLELIYTEAFQQLGVALEIRFFPAARAGAEALAGNVDGELARSLEYEATQTVMIHIPEPTLYVATAAYTLRPDIHLASGWEGLRGTAYRTEYRFGFSVTERKLMAVVPLASLSAVQNSETGLRKLILGRTDLYVDTVEAIEPLLASAEFRRSGIRVASVLQRGPLYAYLNKKHAHLAPRLALILRRMRESGQIERYRLQALKG
jgi:polar amino acid transport system substrate-binding protein